jgi:hypothetical protein
LIALALTLVASSTGCSILWRLSPFLPPRAYTVGLSDLDGDGDLDAVVGNGPDNVDYPEEPNRVWLNDGAGLSWPKTPSVPLDGYHERESECQRSFLVEKTAGGLMQMIHFRRLEVNFKAS